MIIVCSKLQSDPRVAAAVSSLIQRGERVKFMSEDGIQNWLEHRKEAEDRATVVLGEFYGHSIYPALENTRNVDVLGRTIFLERSEHRKTLPSRLRHPLYCSAFEGLNVVLNSCGRPNMENRIQRIRWMGGRVYEKIDSTNSQNINRLIATRVHGPNFRKAVGLEIPCMSPKYILDTWDDKRHLPSFRASDPEYTKMYKRKPFEQCKIYFHGFSQTEQEEFDKYTVKLGGEVALEAAKASHILCHADAAQLRVELDERVFPVTTDWFWNSIQIEARAGERSYRPENWDPEDLTSLSENTSASELTKSRSFDRTISSTNILDEVVNTTAQRKRANNQLSDQSPDRNSHNDSSGEASVISQILARTANLSIRPTRSDFYDSPTRLKSRERFVGEPQKKLSKAIARELLETEENYLNLLRFTVKDLKECLIDDTQSNGQIINPTVAGVIFGNLPDILQLHEAIFKDLQKTVDEIALGKQGHIGQCFVSHSKNMRKEYRSYVGYMDASKQERIYQREENDRFTAFLKLKERSAPGRQGLDGLLMAPVQRLPRISLLLKQYKKEVDQEESTTSELDEAIEQVHKITLEVDEFTAVQNSYRELFGIANEIENCPHTLYSSNRQYVDKIEAVCVRDNPYARVGDQMSLLIFNDCVEITKKKRSRGGSFRLGRSDPKTGLPAKKILYSHRELVYFSEQVGQRDSVTICQVMDILDSERNFLITHRHPTQSEPTELCLQIVVPIDKQTMIQELDETIMKHRATVEAVTDSIISLVYAEQIGKLADPSRHRGIMKLGRKMSFRGEEDNYSLKRYDSQASLASYSSVYSNYSVQSEYTSPNQFESRSRASSMFDQRMKPSSSMFNLPDIPKKMGRTFKNPLKKMVNAFVKPHSPKSLLSSKKSNQPPLASPLTDVNKNS